MQEDLAPENQWLVLLFFFQVENFDILLACFSVLSFLIQPGCGLRPVIFSVRDMESGRFQEKKPKTNQIKPRQT